jgi:hypothetical protein
MKLHRVVVQEMTGPIPYELTMAEIIQAGDATNHYHIFALANLSEFFKNGGVSVNSQLDGIVNISSDATSVRVIETIKSLTPSEKVKLAQYLLDCIKAGEAALHSTQISSSDWLRFVLQKQE